MKQIVPILFLACMTLFACNNNGGQANKEPKKENTAAKKQPAKASNYESPMERLAMELADCVKVEYLMYNLGMTFESPSETEAKRYYGYLVDQPANETNCKKDYDGSIVFKNANGDIKMGMEFNLPQLSNCNRVMFQLDGKEYRVPYNQAGIQFFDQVLKLRQNPNPNGQ